MNLYLILGVSEKADTEAIKKAYRRLVKECHPDTHPGDREAEERFKRISEAYAVLSDEEKRKQYDSKNVKSEKKAQKKETKVNPIDTGALFERYMGFK